MSALQNWAEPRPVKLTSADFLQLAESGAFQQHAKVELIDGVIVAMSPQFTKHARVKSRIHKRLAILVDALNTGLEALVEVSVAVSTDQMPEPDLLLTSFEGDGEAVPVTCVPLVVEIADTTAAFDRGKKAAIYAGGGIPEYWVFDIAAAEVARFWSPGPDGYAYKDAVAFGRRLAAVTLPEIAIETRDL